MNARSSWRIPALLFAAVALATALPGLVGCSDGGAPADAGGFSLPTPDDEAYRAPLPAAGAAIEPAGASTEEALQALVDLLTSGEWPALAQLQLLEDQFLALVDDNPADGGAQLGLVVTSLLTISDESLASVGLDAEGMAALVGALLGDLTPTGDQAAAPAGAVLGLVRIAQDGGEESMSAQDMWGLMDAMLGWLGGEDPASGILGRLAVPASYEGAIATVLIDGQPYEIMPWGPQAMLALAHLARAGMLIATAYDMTDGGWDWSVYLDDESGESEVYAASLADLDSNGDGLLTPAEYAPADPFGTLRSDGAARLAEADQSLAKAAVWTREAIDGMSADDQLPTESMPVDWETLSDIVDVADALRTSPVSVSLDVALEMGGECTVTQSAFTVTLEPLLAGEITDLKDFLPTLASDGQGGWLPTTLPDSTVGGLFPEGVPLTLMGATDFQLTSIGGVAIPSDPDWNPCE